MLKLLQVCNVGRIVGGTAACAWSVARSLPRSAHAVAFLSGVSEETRRAFAGCDVMPWDRVTAARVAAARPDVVLLHNTPRHRAEARLPAVMIQYLHSRITPAAAHLTLSCSGWLAAQYAAPGGGVVLHQGVPRPPAARGPDARALRPSLVVGRICTPVPRKWPAAVVAFYAKLARRFPEVDWEFVGCPPRLAERLREACRGRAAFFPASWEARSRLWHWDVLLYHNPDVTESFGRTAAEAMRAGCVPVVDDRGGFREQVEPGCGFLCADERAFAEAIATLRSAGTRRRMSRRCRAVADERFSLRRFGEELVEAFRRAAE